jgi:hypothetical protein
VVSHFPHHLIATFHLIVNLFQLIIFVNLYKIRSPKALLLHFKRFIVTQEVKADKTSGQNSDQNDNKPADPPRMEMILRKNEVYKCVFSPIIHYPYCVVHPPLIPLFESSSIQAKIPLKESLSIYPFVGKKVEESPPSIYHLRGVVHHVGSTAFSGHYTTCGKRSICGENTTGPRENEEQWMFFDDRVGTKKSVNYVTDYERNQRSCYMALYELAEVNATVETDDSTLKEASQHTTRLRDSDDNPPAINEAAASIHVNDPENDPSTKDDLFRKEDTHDDLFWPSLPDSDENAQMMAQMLEIAAEAENDLFPREDTHDDLFLPSLPDSDENAQMTVQMSEMQRQS